MISDNLQLLILKTLARGPNHGFGIALHIQNASRGLLSVEEGSLYPALHRLERKQWIKAEWTVSDNNQQVKSYQLTALGRKQLAHERSNWDKVSEAMAGILHPGKAEGE